MNEHYARKIWQERSEFQPELYVYVKYVLPITSVNEEKNERLMFITEKKTAKCFILFYFTFISKTIQVVVLHSIKIVQN